MHGCLTARELSAAQPTTHPCHPPEHVARSRLVGADGVAGEREKRVFQLLPMLGGPWFLRPLVSVHWRKVLGLPVGDRMLDEALSSLPGIRSLSFRHIFVCAKGPGWTENAGIVS